MNIENGITYTRLSNQISTITGVVHSAIYHHICGVTVQITSDEDVKMMFELQRCSSLKDHICLEVCVDALSTLADVAKKAPKRSLESDNQYNQTPKRPRSGALISFSDAEQSESEDMDAEESIQQDYRQSNFTSKKSITFKDAITLPTVTPRRSILKSSNRMNTALRFVHFFVTLSFIVISYPIIFIDH